MFVHPFAPLPPWNPRGNPMSTVGLFNGVPASLEINTAYLVAHSPAAVPFSLPGANMSAGSQIIIQLAQNGESSVDLIKSNAGDVFWLSSKSGVQSTIPPLTGGNYQLLAVEGSALLGSGNGVWIVSSVSAAGQNPEIQFGVRTVNFNASVNKLYLLDASAGNITITAPAPPTKPALAQGDRLAVLCSAPGGINAFIVDVAPNLIWDETTLLPGYGTSVTVLANAGTYREWVYDLTNTTWFRVGKIDGDVLT